VTEADRAIAALVKEKAAIVVWNKIDLVDANARSDADALLGASVLPDAPTVPISALTGQGLGELEEAIIEAVFSGQVESTRAPVVTSPRHKEALNRALDHVVAAHSAYEAGQLADLVAIDLTAAVRALGEITGQTASEGLVETIFGKFCIGK
jgi:tRNA modification GTPase